MFLVPHSNLPLFNVVLISTSIVWSLNSQTGPQSIESQKRSSLPQIITEGWLPVEGSAQCFDGISISFVRATIADGFFRLFHFQTWRDCPFSFAYLCVSVAISSAIEIFLVLSVHVLLVPHRIIASQHLVGFFSCHLLNTIFVSLSLIALFFLIYPSLSSFMLCIFMSVHITTLTTSLIASSWRNWL